MASVFDIENEKDFIDAVSYKLDWLRNELRQVQADYMKNRGKYSPDEYRAIIRYFLRKHSVPDKDCKILFKGSKIRLEFNVNYSFSKFAIEVTSDSSSLYSVSNRNLSPEEIQEENVKTWKKHYKKYGLKESDLGRVFTNVDGRVYRICGCKPRIQTYSIKVQEVNTDRTCAFRHQALKELLEKEEKSNGN